MLPPVLAPKLGELVLDDGDDSLGGGELGAEAEGEEHEEEEDGPEGADGHPGDCLGVGDKGKAGACRGKLKFKRIYCYITHSSLIG